MLHQAVAAQKGGGCHVRHAQALEQGVGGVGAARQVRAVQAHGLGGQGFELGRQRQGLYRFNQGALGQVGSVGGQVCNSETRASAAQQQGGDSGEHAFGVLVQCQGDALCGG